MKIKELELNSTIESVTISDRLELYRIVDNEWILEVHTDNELCGQPGFAGDAVTDYFLSAQATDQSIRYTHCSIGTDGTDGSVYSLNELKYPVLNPRIATTNSVGTTNVTNDTSQFMAVIECTGDWILQESGLFTAATGGFMGARQTYYDWEVDNGETIGIIWKIINNRS